MKIIFFVLVAAFLAAATAVPVYGQSVERVAVQVRGKLLNKQTGIPVEGATIRLKGSKTAAQSGSDGSFTIQAPIGAVLVLSSVGFEIYEIKIKAEDLGGLLLDPENSSLDDVQIIAYGKTSRRTSTGNTSTLKAADIVRQPVGNPLLALTGRIPGLVINQSTGFSGSGVKVQIQGQSSVSVNVSNDPLYVIDGVPYPSRLLFSTKNLLGISGGKSPTTLDGLKAGAGNPFSFINPGDIESIDVLKDADATAIYGSRAANGAILISTKRGKAGPTKVDVNVQQGVGEVGKMLELLGSKQYLQMRREAIKNSGYTIGDADYDLNGTWDTTRYTNWQKALIGGTGHYTDAQGSVSGGTESTRFMLGTAFHRETTVFPGDFSDKKGSVRLSLNHVSPNQKLKVQFSGVYLSDNNHLPDKDLTDLSLRLSPVAPGLYLGDGQLNWAPDQYKQSTWINPLSYFKNQYTIKTSNLSGSAVLGYEVFPGLELSSNFGYVRLQSAEKDLVFSTGVAPEQRNISTWRTSTYNTNSITSWLIEPQLNYKREVWKGKLEVLLGSTIQKSTNELQIQMANGYANDLVVGNTYAAQSVTVVDGNSVYRYNAGFGRINYNLADKYLFNFTARRDGSSRFGASNRFHNFGAIGLGWVFSKEKLIADNLPFLSFGKLRGSYGTTGNDQISDYQYAAFYQNTTTGYQNAPGLSPVNQANSHLQWEETRKLQFGLDAGFLKDRILISAGYYRNKSSNQLLNAFLPAFTGYTGLSGFQQNIDVVVQNYGWEFSLNTTNISSSSSWMWTSNANLTIPKNKLLSFPGLENSAYANSLMVGQPLTITKVYHSMGVDPATGIYQVADENGEAYEPDLFSPRNKNVLINTAPKFYGGLQNSIRYKSLELDFLLQFVKQISYNYRFGADAAGYFAAGLLDQGGGNQPLSVWNHWRKAGDVQPVPRYDISIAKPWSVARNSDAGYSDASYIRIKNASLSWWLPERWSGRMRMAKARLYVQGQNLLTFTKYDGFDPEIPFLPGSAMTLPPLRVLTAGIQVTLQ